MEKLICVAIFLYRFQLFPLFALLSIGCKPTVEDYSNVAAAGDIAVFEIEIGDHNTYIKRSLETDTTLAEGRGREYCTLYAKGKYQLYASPENHGNHIKVNIVDFNKKGCDFSSGYVFLEHTKFGSKGMKVISFDGKKVSIGVVKNLTELLQKKKHF